MPPITLTVIAGPAAGATCTKDAKKSLLLGRNKTGNAIPLKDDMVSGKHIEITWVDGSWFALDLKSSNGTKLNDSEGSFLEGQTYKLRSGDQLHLGPDTIVQVQFQGSSPDDTMTVADKLTADAQRLAANIKAAAEASVQQIRQEWAEQRQALQGLVQS